MGTKPGFWLLLLLFTFFTASASAAEITYVSINGIWHDPTDNVAGTQPGEPVITNGVPTSIIRWGVTSGTPQSGYDITTTLPPPQTFPGPAPLFSLGTFTHRNFEVSPPSLTSVQLDVVLMLSVDGVPTGPLTFTYTFNHEETPNGMTPCPFPTPPGEGCTDRVTIVSQATPTTFQIDGVDYTLSLNFLVNGNPVSEFITREGGTTNTSGLVGQFTLPPGTPQMMVMKSGPATMNPGVPGDFVLNAQNTGVFSAYNVTLLDRLPNGPTGGMCDTTPQVLSARVFAADGTTPVAGKGPLVQGTDYSLAYDGVTCELTLRTLTAASVVGVGERLIIAYRTQLDADTQNGITLTNVAGATEWYNDFPSNPGRSGYTRTLTDGTVDTYDHEDAHTVNVMPRLYAEKAAALQVDRLSPGLVDPGDVLRYTIRIHNYSLLPFTQAMLRDLVPPNTTYVADTMTLNGQPVRRPDGGISPLIAGVDVSSSDLPMPGSGAGIVSPGQTAVVQFDLRVNDGTPPGTVIRNQATVTTAELPTLRTDGDGNPATGPEPTVVVVAGPQQMRITKDVAVVGGGPAIAGATLEYTVKATNSGSVPAYAVVLRDDIAVPMPGYLTFVNGSYTMNDSTNGITVVDSLLTADYSTTYGALPPGGSVTLKFRAVLNASLAIGTKVTNTGMVYWNDPQQTASASVSIDVGGMVGVGILNGRAWHDANFNKVFDATERPLERWTVELLRNGSVTYTATTDATGTYVIAGVTPNYQTTDKYELRFTAPGAGARTAKLGRADSAFSNGLQRIYDIVVQPNSNLLNLNLPIEPNGVIYNSMSRAPIPGATVTMVQAGSRAALPESCFDDPAQQGQIALAQGYYRFDLNFTDPACPTGGDFALEVVAPGSGYVAGYSEIIPPAATDATEAFSVPSCPGSMNDAIPATSQRCEVQPSELQPGAAIAARSAGTIYHVHLTFDDGQVPGSSQIFNNHIPVDPMLDGALAITKTTPTLNVSRGQLVPYTITVRNVGEMPLQDVRVADRFPAGFHYVPGSAQIDGVKVEPTSSGRELHWSNLSFGSTGQHSIVLLLAVGSGVSQGEFVNRAQAMNAITGRAMSSEATATVRIVPDPTFDCTDVTGKVFNDANRNGLQESGEDGIPGVRLVTTNGLVALTDAHGRFHITCAATPHEGRGSNFVLKLDDRTLPSGYRPSTHQLVTQRATRGKTLRFSFGASIHRAVSLDLMDAAFEPGSTEIRLQWQPRMDLLIAELRKAPSVLRLSYLGDVENEDLVQRRLKVVKQQILDAWKAGDASYALDVEPEVFWRRGAPPKPARPGADR